MDDFMAALVKMDKEGTDSFGALSDVARTATGGIETAITTMKQSISNAIVAVIQEIGAANIESIITSIKDTLVGVVKVVGNIITFLAANKWVLDAIMAFFVGILALGITQKITVLFTTLSAFMTTNPVLLGIGAVSAAIFLLMTHVEEVGQFFYDVFTSVGQFLTGVTEGIKAAFQGVWDFVTGIFGTLASFFGSIFGSAWEAVKNVFSTGGQIFMGIVDGITNAFRTIVNAIITGINHVVAIPFNAINGFLSFLKGIDIMGIKPFDWVATIDVPQIPTLAQGGIANGATQAVIGEAGKEAVLPLENNTDNWAGLLASTLVDEMEAEGRGFAGVTIEKQEFVINNQLDAEDIGRVMMQSIRRAA